MTGIWLTPFRSIFWRADHSSVSGSTYFSCSKGSMTRAALVVAHSGRGTSLIRCKVIKPNGLVSSVNEETALPATEDLLVYQLLERQIFRNNGAMRTHGLRNGMARQQK